MFLSHVIVAVVTGATLTLGQVASAQLDTASLRREAQRIYATAKEDARDIMADRQAVPSQFRKAAELYQKIGAATLAAEAYYQSGHFYLLGGQLDSALTSYRISLQLTHAAGESRNEGPVRGEMALAWANAGFQDSAMAYFQKALEIFRSVGDRAQEGFTLGNLGTVFQSNGQADSALSHFGQALAIAVAVQDSGQQAKLLANLGVVYAGLGLADSALTYYRNALVLERATKAQGGEALTLGNIGSLFLDINVPDSAIFYYRAALPLLRMSLNRVAIAAVLGNIGAVFRDVGHYDSALTYHRASLSERRAIHDRPGEGTALNNIGYVFAGMSQYDSALVYYREALSIHHETGDRVGEAGTLDNIADSYRWTNRVDSALVYFERSAALFSALSRRTGSELTQITFNEDKLVYALWALTWLAVPTSPGNPNRGMYAALAVSERGRAQALLDLMRDSAATIEPATDLPAEGVRFARTFQRSGSAALVYFQTPDTLITWVIPVTGDPRVFRVAMSPDSLAALVAGFRNQLGVTNANTRIGLRGSSLEASESAAASESLSASGSAFLGETILPRSVRSLLALAGEVVIVPQGSLASLPFAALPLDADGHLFGETVAIRYAPSLGVLEQAEREGIPDFRSPAPGRSLVVGNPSMPEISFPGGRDRLAPLPGAENEARSIARELTSPVLSGPAATEAEVIRRLPTAPVVHLATHGFAYSAITATRNSFVALAPDSSHDGLLTVRELLENPAIRLHAELVALSACQTGLGNLSQAEGTVGLQRAFLAKGARSVLVSLWNVSDQATSALMRAFYRHWLRDRDHPSKAESLRRSQEEIRHTRGWEAPRYWAAFQLVGAR